MSDKRDSRKDGLTVARSWKGQSIMVAGQGGSWSHSLFGPEAGRDERRCPPHLLLFLCSVTPVQGMGPPTFMVDLLTLFN